MYHGVFNYIMIQNCLIPVLNISSRITKLLIIKGALECNVNEWLINPILYSSHKFRQQHYKPQLSTLKFTGIKILELN